MVDNVRASGIRKSLFPAKTTVLTGASFDYFTSGVNYQITFDNFKTALGVTGTIATAGAITGTPVLQTIGTANAIRNLEDGAGVKSSLSPENGITLEHNFTVDAVGIPIMVNPTALSPRLPSMVAGAGMAVTASADGKQVVFSVSPSTVTNKTVVVAQESDFPAEVGGIITLADETDYLLVNDITTASRFVLGNSCIVRASGAGIIRLTYIGTDAMFSGIDKSFSVEKISIACPDGDLFDVSSTGPGAVAQLLETQVVECETLGNIDGQFITRIDGVSFLNIKTNGFTFTGTNQTFITDQVVIFLFGGSLFDFGTSTFVNILISNQVVEASAGGTTFITGAASSANLLPGGLASVTNTRISGSATALSGVTPTDVLWEFNSNDDIPDTKEDALISVTGNALETAIASTSSDGSNAVKMNAVWTIGPESHFEADTTGRIVYTGIKTTPEPIDFSVTLAMASGGDQQVSAYIALNGTPITSTGMQTTASSTKVGAATIIWQHNFVTGDYVEVFLEGVTSTINIVGQRSVGRIN